MNDELPLVNLEEYNQNGFVVLRRAINASICEQIQGSIWSKLEKVHGIRSADPSTWTIEDPRGLTDLRRDGVLEPTATNVVVRAVDQIMGDRRWNRPHPWGGALVTFPSPGPWQFPENGWHIDYPARGNPGRHFGVKLLGLLKDMKSGGGATLLSPGSHRLVRQLAEEQLDGDAGKSADVRRKLYARGTDFRTNYFEFTGGTGDVLLFDPWLFHAPSRNVMNTPRMMVEQNIPSVDALKMYVPVQSM